MLFSPLPFPSRPSPFPGSGLRTYLLSPAGVVTGLCFVERPLLVRVIINPFTEMVPNVKAPEEEEEGTQSAETLGGLVCGDRIWPSGLGTVGLTAGGKGVLTCSYSCCTQSPLASGCRHSVALRAARCSLGDGDRAGSPQCPAALPPLGSPRFPYLPGCHCGRRPPGTG